MELLGVDILRSALDLAVLMLCGITVAYIAKKKGFLEKKKVPVSSEKRIEKIVHRAFYHLVRENEDRFFVRPVKQAETVAAAAGGGRRFTVGNRGAGGRLSAGGTFVAAKAGGAAQEPLSGREKGQSTHVKVYRFAESGMSVDKISEKLAVPRCEVELMAKFQPHMGGTSGMGGGRRQGGFQHL